MKKIFEQVVPGKQGLAVELRPGQHLRVVDLEGRQVVDMALFNLQNPREKLSTSYSRTRYRPRNVGDYIPRDRLTAGDTLMSTLCRPMMTLIEETAPEKGVHDSHNRMCNRYLYEVQLGLEPQDGCHEIISKAIAPYGLLPEDVPDTFDINMRYEHDCANRRWVIGLPASRAGDHVEFRAEMPLLAALSVCPLESGDCNGGKSTPVRVEVYEAA
ncbi:MAG TPA: urea carboxylase-associated family protein [Burkholderiaceae bacterium]|jgi:uncharacterized protein|nr:urea carboxylase-associated family protein [Burkholderiaceae bacterium]